MTMDLEKYLPICDPSWFSRIVSGLLFHNFEIFGISFLIHVCVPLFPSSYD